MESIQMADFVAKLATTKITVLDVREVLEYEAGHVPGVQNKPLSQIDSWLKDLKTTEQYYIICRSGSRSVTATNFLTQNGFQAINVAGGTISWPHDLV